MDHSVLRLLSLGDWVWITILEEVTLHSISLGLRVALESPIAHRSSRDLCGRTRLDLLHVVYKVHIEHQH